MQEASGTDFTTCNWCAQPSSADLAANFDSRFPHFPRPRISFGPLVRAIARCTDVPGRISHVRCSVMSVRLQNSRSVAGLVQQVGISRLALAGAKPACACRRS